MADAERGIHYRVAQNTQNGNVDGLVLQVGYLGGMHVHEHTSRVANNQNMAVWFGIKLKIKNGKLVASLRRGNSGPVPVYSATVMPVSLAYHGVHFKEYIPVMEPNRKARPKKLPEFSRWLNEDLRELKEDRDKFELSEAVNPKPWLIAPPTDKMFVELIRHQAGVFVQYWQGGHKWIQEPNGSVYRSHLDFDSEWGKFMQKKRREFRNLRDASS